MGSSSSKNANSQGHTQASSGAQHGKPTGPNELTRLKLREAELLAELEKVRVLEAGANRGAVGTKTIGSDPCNVSVNVSGVTLSTVLGHGTIATSTPTRVKALVTVRTEPPGPEAVRRAPVFVCVVLDKSGSMDGTKLTFAKKAATKVTTPLYRTRPWHQGHMQFMSLPDTWIRFEFLPLFFRSSPCVLICVYAGGQQCGG